LAGPFITETFKDEEPQSLEALDIKKVLYLDGYATLPQVEAKDKENNKTLPKSVESALNDAKASAAEPSKEESTQAGPTGAGETGGGEIKTDSTGGTTGDKSTLITSNPAPSSVDSGLPVESTLAQSTVVSAPPIELTASP